MIEDALVAKLKAYAALVALVDTRIFPSELPMGSAYPQLTYWAKDTKQPGRTLRDAGGLCKKTFQIDAWSDRSEEYNDIKQIEEALRNCFDTGGGQLWPYAGGSHFVQHFRIEENMDETAPPVFDANTGMRAVSLNLIVVFEQALPTH